MTKKARDKIAEGLHEAIAVARGQAEPARLHVPTELDVKAIRAKTGLSQESFAYAFGFTVEQIRSWEQRCEFRRNPATDSDLMPAGIPI
jgi:putative transcriptional regulator